MVRNKLLLAGDGVLLAVGVYGVLFNGGSGRLILWIAMLVVAVNLLMRDMG